ncbi:hypothetical protein F4677DRAFT_452602 [Hypoxylon crocopeplum]|nr:hypothetical protein F4677DRAFT_452602 [Hypoxylon crocopeplum]
MSDQRIRRLVVLVDGSEQQGENQPQSNQTNIRRLHRLVQDGLITDALGRTVLQIPKYYTAVGNLPRFSDKFKGGKAKVDDTEKQIKDIAKEVASTLETPEDELYLFGSGHGAFVVRAVAGIIHHMGLLKRQSLSRFDELYDCTLALQKARLEDDHRRGPKLLQTIKAHADTSPRIPFVGLFDCVKFTTAKTDYDTSFVSSIQTLRLALALNENRSNRIPLLFDFPKDLDMAHHSFIQAWFVGTTDDLGGGTQNDGLSLYPLQWMLLESMRAGLILSHVKRTESAREDPLSLAFPQYAGNLPNLDGSEEIEWCLTYTNGIRISMFDLQSSHTSKQGNEGDSTNINMNPERYSRGVTRKIFGPTGLNGWDETGPYGTVIHPSVFCIIDRYPRFLELGSFKPLKPQLADFQDKCLIDSNNSLPPWLHDMQLQASGVKAFRILVCGKTGVGKSTLINKVFGVEITEESQTYQQGVHNINEAFESPKHPGLLIHDSRGWQAGSDTELDLIAKFLRHRAFQRDPAEALHVIWFCVDADVSRIEEADKRTFETIAQFSNQVPVFIVGTKKDKLVNYRKMQLLERLMEKTDDFREASRIASEEASKLADEQFSQLRDQLSLIEHYKADGYCCLSKDDDAGIKSLLSQTLGLIADERVRLFCVAAQVVDVEQKINSAITECMRLGTHAIRTAAVPLPFSGVIGTPTVSRLICEHVLQCFGFPKATPAEIEEIMERVVMGNLKSFMTVSLTQMLAVGAVTIGVAVATAGIGSVIGAAGCLIGLPPTARMLLKCACDMILILERSFRYDGKYVSVKQIEDAAKYYATTRVRTFAGKEKRLQQHVHDQIDQLVPLKKFSIGIKFQKLRGGMEEIIYGCRFGKPPEYDGPPPGYEEMMGIPRLELDGNMLASELGSVGLVAELEGDPVIPSPSPTPQLPELDSSEHIRTPATAVSPVGSFGNLNPTMTGASEPVSELSRQPSIFPSISELGAESVASVSRDNLETTLPTRARSDNSSGFRWGKPSSWKMSMKKSKSSRS